MKLRILVLAASGLLLASCTSMMPSAPPMRAIPRLPASECLTSCPTLPLHPQGADELGSMLWLYDLIDVAGECRRLHDACRTSK